MTGTKPAPSDDIMGSRDTDNLGDPDMLKRMHIPQWSTKGFLRDRQGSVIIVVAVSMAMIAGFSALAVDMGYLYSMKNRLQATADAAATAGASQLGVDEATVKAEATAYAAKNMPAGDHGTVLTDADVVLGHWDNATREFIPMGTGAACANPVALETDTTCLAIDAVSVTVRRAEANGNPAPLYFAAVLGREQIDVVASAIARVDTTTGDVCMLVLHPNLDGALEMSGTNVLEANDCGIVVHSTSEKAFKLPGDVDLELEFVCVVDDVGVEQSGPITWIPDPPGDSVIKTNCSPPPDPFASMPDPPVGVCDFDDYVISSAFSNVTLNPGVYCGGMTFSGDSSTITFNPGIYILKGGGMLFSAANNIVTGSEVMFFNTDNGGTYGNIEFSGGGTDVELSAQTSGTYAGFLFYQDHDAAPGDFFFNVNGNVLADFDGVIYMPDQLVEFSGNSALNVPCGPKIIAYTVKFNGNNGTFGGVPGCASNLAEITITWTFTPLVM